MSVRLPTATVEAYRALPAEERSRVAAEVRRLVVEAVAGFHPVGGPD